MAGRRGAPESNGSWAQTPSGAKTKAYARLFETISSSGCNDEGVAWGVHYVSTRRVTGGGQLSKMDAWPALKSAFAHWKRAVQSAAAQMPAMARALSPSPPKAPSMEALMEAFDVKTVVREFMNGNYVLYPAESAEGFHCTDERFGTNALSAMVYRKGSTAWHVVDAVHEYELSTKKLATVRAISMRTPTRTGRSEMAQSAPSRLQQLMRPEAKVNADREAAENAGVELPDVTATWNFGDLISESDSGVSDADSTRQIRARTGKFTDEFEQFVCDVIEKVASHEVRLQYEARTAEYVRVDRALIPLIVSALDEGQMCCLPGVDEMKSGIELWTALCRYHEGHVDSMSSLVKAVDAWTKNKFDDTLGFTAFENEMGVHLRMIKDSEKINQMSVEEFVELMNMAIMLSRIGKSPKYAEVVGALRREDNLEMSRLRSVLREHERVNKITETSSDGGLQLV